MKLSSRFLLKATIGVMALLTTLNASAVESFVCMPKGTYLSNVPGASLPPYSFVLVGLFKDNNVYQPIEKVYIIELSKISGTENDVYYPVQSQDQTDKYNGTFKISNQLAGRISDFRSWGGKGSGAELSLTLVEKGKSVLQNAAFYCSSGLGGTYLPNRYH